MALAFDLFPIVGVLCMYEELRVLKMNIKDLVVYYESTDSYKEGDINYLGYVEMLKFILKDIERIIIKYS